MVREILEIFLNFIKSRLFILVVIICLMFGLLYNRVFTLQIVNSDSYIEQYSQKTEKTRYYSSNRGNIYDCNGELLAYNVSVYSVVIEDTLDSSSYKSDQLNQIIDTTINLVEKYGDSVDTDFAIQYVDGEFVWKSTLSNNSRLRFLKDIFGTEVLDTETQKLSETTPREAFEYLSGESRYDVDMSLYSEEQALKIVIIRYALSLNAFQKYISTTIATDVSEETVAAIYESSDIIPGVTISQTSKRVYNDAVYFAHIIGYTGKISDEQMSEYNAQIDDENNKYEINDVVGKNGVEYSMELELSGTKGYDKVIVDNTGKVISVVEEKEQIAGNDLYLTIDSNLQKAVYHLIEESIAGILVEKIVNRELTEADATKWLIPIKDVCFQIINNNIVDIDAFSLDSATENEKKVYGLMLNKKQTVLENISNELYNDDAVKLSSLSEEYNSYYTFIFNMLSDSSYNVNLIPKSNIDTDDEIYKSWMKDELSLRQIILYAIDNNWVDTSLLNVSSNYIDREAIYSALTDYIYSYLESSDSFDKLLYQYLIYQNTITAEQVCRLIYDQGILEYDESRYNSLKNGSLSAYDFMIDKIYNLEITPAMLALDPCSGTVTVVESGTGNVLAMVSYPSYDNNSFSGSIDYETWNTLSNDLSNPLFDRATKMRVPPGSTFKPVSAVAGLETGVIDMNTTVCCTGIYETITPSPKCWIYPGGHGSLSVTGAIQNSCNVFFYEVGYRLACLSGKYSESDGLNILKKYGSMFGLTETSGVEIEEYQPSFSDTSPISSAIGQGSHSFTSTQLARYVNSIASDGTNYELTLIKDIVDRDGNSLVLPEKDVTQIDVAASSIQAAQLGMLYAANSYGLSNAIGFEVAAKTGTSQENANSPDHALLISYAPYDSPEISMSAMIQNGYASGYALELTQRVMKYYFGQTTYEQILNGNAGGPAKTVVTEDTAEGAESD